MTAFSIFENDDVLLVQYDQSFAFTAPVLEQKHNIHCANRRTDSEIYI